MTEEPTTTEQTAAAHEEKGDLRGTIIRLVVASLVVGLIMKWSGFTPITLLHFLGDSFRDIFDNIGSVAATVGEWLLLGATIVVPVWFVMRLLGRRR
ncbi:MAG: DUF6460 domain-containing protein [Proteobacteria bacterium]|nr:DUF6460 domain-containing protein [Pseudomonadota bacterium]